MFPRKDDPLLLLIDAMSDKNPSGAIERSEARGQRLLINSETLPHKINSGTREQFEKIGIVFGEKADDLFSYVTLPQGWTKKPTDHSMWSKLIDEHGRDRASIFYKAAIYDRDAFMNISRRYSVSLYESTDKDGNPVDYQNATHFATCILDCGKPIHLIGLREKGYGNPESDKHEKSAYQWIDENFPDWKNPLAYW